MKNNDSRGFSLLELSIVLIIVGFVTVGALDITKGMINLSNRNDTAQKLRIIESAINSYIIKNRKLPCPGGIKLKTSNEKYGKENCLQDSTSGIKLIDNNILIGGLAIEDLKLNQKYSYDGWGNKFIYIVMKDYTGTNNNLLKNNIEDKYLINNKYFYAIISNGANKIGGIWYDSDYENLKLINKASGGEKGNIFNNISSNEIWDRKDSTDFDDIVLVRNKENIIQDLGIFDIGCIIKNNLNDIILSKCSKDLIFSNINIGDYIEYGEKKYSSYKDEVLESNDNVMVRKQCVIECAKYGELAVYLKTTEIK